MKKNIAVIGSGSWGVALAIHLAKLGNNIKALDACRKYAVECAKNGRCVYTAKSIDDLLG